MRGVDRAREEPRDRVLDSGELAALSAALDQLDQRFPRERRGDSGRGADRACESLRCWLDSVGEYVDLRERARDAAGDEDGPAGASLPVRGARHRARDAAHQQERPRVRRRRSGAADLSHGPHPFHDGREAGRAAGREATRPEAVATGAAAAGVSAPILQQLLGHKTAQAANRYVRDLGASVADARRAIGAAMAAAMAGEGGRD